MSEENDNISLNGSNANVVRGFQSYNLPRGNPRLFKNNTNNCSNYFNDNTNRENLNNNIRNINFSSRHSIRSYSDSHFFYNNNSNDQFDNAVFSFEADDDDSQLKYKCNSEVYNNLIVIDNNSHNVSIIDDSNTNYSSLSSYDNGNVAHIDYESDFPNMIDNVNANENDKSNDCNKSKHLSHIHAAGKITETNKNDNLINYTENNENVTLKNPTYDPEKKSDTCNHATENGRNRSDYNDENVNNCSNDKKAESFDNCNTSAYFNNDAKNNRTNSDHNSNNDEKYDHVNENANDNNKISQNDKSRQINCSTIGLDVELRQETTAMANSLFFFPRLVFLDDTFDQLFKIAHTRDILDESLIVKASTYFSKYAVDGYIKPSSSLSSSGPEIRHACILISGTAKLNHVSILSGPPLNLSPDELRLSEVGSDPKSKPKLPNWCCISDIGSYDRKYLPYSRNKARKLNFPPLEFYHSFSEASEKTDSKNNKKNDLVSK
eukprot:Awhi_evm1s3151